MERVASHPILSRDADPRLDELTARERAVLAVLAETPSTAVIAERLVVSTNTVKTQLRSVYRKLDANTREQALTRAMALHLLNPASALRAPEAGHGQD
ncbi:MAG: helix-turn-helix transcriptional regulator [Microbacteriaceae bacterium]|nr:helix-turn-helix transcriptional regulator [Microbacteriaceae bacterium]